MPDLPSQEPVFGSELPSTIAHRQMPAGTGEAIDTVNESIGEYLRRNRLRIGKTLTDISRSSKIPTYHLTAIENNAFEELPGRAYAIGFVRSYAVCLGLDAGALVARLRAEMTEPEVDPAFAAPHPPWRNIQAGTAAVENGKPESSSAETRPRLQGGKFADWAERTRELQIPVALLRFKEIAKRTGELKFALSSPARRSDQPAAAPGETGNGREHEFRPFSAPLRAAPSTAHRRMTPHFPTPERGMPLPSPSEHPVRNWLTAGLMGIAIIYFGSSIIHSGLGTAPPPITPVPARLVADARLAPEKVERPVVAVPEQPARSASEALPVRPAKDQPGAVAPVEKPAIISHGAAVDSPSEAIVAPSDSANVEPKRVFAQLPLGQRYGEQNRGSRVTLRMHRPTFVAVLGIRNHQFIDRVLRAGDTYRVPNMRGLRLNTRDAGAIEVILDGNTVGFAGKDGVAVKAMSLQPQSIVTRYHWLQE